MTAKVENRSLGEQLEFQGTEVEFSNSKFGKPKITYTRDLLLEFTEACRKLPEDFDQLALSQLNGAVERQCWDEDLACAFMSENKWISGNPSALGALPSHNKWISGNPSALGALPSQNKWISGNPSALGALPSQNKWISGNPSALGALPSQNKWISGNPSALGAFPSRRLDKGEKWSRHLLMPSKESHSQDNCSSERSGVVSQQLPPESGYDDVFSGQKTPKSVFFKSFDQLRKSRNPYRPPHLNKKLSQPSDTSSELGVESSGSSLFSTAESDQRGSSDSTTGSDEPGYDSLLASEMIGAIDKPESEIINDSGLTYEEFWADSQLQECKEASCRKNEASEMIGGSDKLELGIIDNNQPPFEDFWADILESFRQQQEAELGPTPASDADVDICLPNEDRLISVDNFNMLDNSDDAANSETEIVWPDEDSLISLYDMIGPYSSVPINIEKPSFQPVNHDDMNFHTKSNCIPYVPSPNCFNYFDLLYPSYFAGTNPNDFLVPYSLYQQPYISPWLHYPTEVFPLTEHLGFGDYDTLFGIYQALELYQANYGFNRSGLL